MIMTNVSVADGSNNAGVDSAMWQEKHGIVLPPIFPVVQVKMGGEKMTQI
jgi:hypothetical protein